MIGFDIIEFKKKLYKDFNIPEDLRNINGQPMKLVNDEFVPANLSQIQLQVWNEMEDIDTLHFKYISGGK